MRKLMIILMTVALVLPVFVLASSSQPPSLPVYEGPGSATPEDAVRLYFDGLRSENLAGILSAFAIETYVAHFDYEAQLQRMRAHMPSMSIAYPSVNGLFASINIESRKQEIVNAVKTQLATSLILDFDPMTPTTFTGDDLSAEIAAFVKKLEDGLGSMALLNLDLLGFESPSSLNEMYDDERNQENLARMAGVYGTDEIRSVVATFTAGVKNYIFCCDTIRYGESWYMLSLGGNIGNLLNISPALGGIMPVQ